jgi:hypothetical protein
VIPVKVDPADGGGDSSGQRAKGDQMSHEVAEQLEKLLEALTGRKPNGFAADGCERIVQIIPGGGWIEVCYDEGTDEVFTSPVVAWALTVEGEIKAMTADSTGLVDDAIEEPYGFLHPPGEELDIDAAIVRLRESVRQHRDRKPG